MSALTEEPPTVVEETPAEPRGSLRERWVPLGLVLGCCLLNFWVSQPAVLQSLSVYAVQGLGGAVMAQYFLCGLWGALAARPIKWRVPTAFAVVMLLVFSQMRGSVYMWAGSLLLCATYFLALTCLRRFRGLVLSARSPSDTVQQDEELTRFDLRYLFTWTTVIAVLAAMGGMNTWYSSRDGILSWFVVWMTFAIVVLPGCMATMLILKSGPRPLATYVYLVLSFPLAIIEHSLMQDWSRYLHSSNTTFELTTSWTHTLWCGASVLGALLASSAYSVALRLAGYRLHTAAPNP